MDLSIQCYYSNQTFSVSPAWEQCDTAVPFCCASVGPMGRSGTNCMNLSNLDAESTESTAASECPSDRPNLLCC
ncbi:TPA: hypothetical protein ACH3X3_004492 [Trebouxia sp. C0006]